MKTDFGILIPRTDYGLCFLVKHIPYSVWVMLTLVFCTFDLLGQIPGMSCTSKVNVTLGSNGKALVASNMFLRTADPTHVVVDIGGTGSNMADCSMVGTVQKVMLRDTMTGALCWADLTVEDKAVFEITTCIPDTAISCFTDPSLLDIRDFVDIDDNCLTLEQLLVTSPDPPYIDEPPITEPYAYNPDTLKVMRRIWILKDGNGNIRRCTTDIAFLRLDFDLLQAPPDTTIYCPDDPSDIAVTGDIPYDHDLLWERCEIAVDFSMISSSPLLCDKHRKYTRIWKFADWARDTVLMRSQEITWRDTFATKLLRPEPLNFVADEENCGFKLVVEPPGQMPNEQGCTMTQLISIQVRVDGNLVAIGDTIPLDFGMHSIIYTGMDDCGNPAIPSMDTSFSMEDMMGPQIVCALHNVEVAISNGCDAWVRADSLFQGSVIDLCSDHVVIKARKVTDICTPPDTEFKEIITFCAEEAFNPVEVQVVAVDTMTMMYSDTCTMFVGVQVSPVLVCKSDTVRIYLSDLDTIARIDSFIVIDEIIDKIGLASFSMTGSGTVLTGSGMPFTGSGLPFFVDGQFMEFDCDDLDIYHVKVKATNVLGKSDSCTAILEVRDTSNLCPDMRPANLDPGIHGVVMAEGYMPVSHAEVTLRQGDTEYFTLTDREGVYTFEDLTTKGNYQLNIEYPDGWKRGLSAFDLYLLQRYVVGLSEMDDVYAMLSADVNGSGRIDALDLLDLKKLILNKPIAIEEQTEPWIFVPSTSTFNEDLLSDYLKSSSFDIPVDRNITWDLDATKRGDIDGDAMNSVETRSNSMVTIVADRALLQKGVEYAIQLRLDSNMDIRAAQWSLAVRDAAIADVASPIFENDVYDNMVTSLYYADDRKELGSNDRIIELRIVPERSARVDEIFDLTDQVRPLVFDVEGRSHRAVLAFEIVQTEKLGPIDTPIAMELLPNPVHDQGLFRVYNAPALLDNLTIRVVDMLGRQVLRQQWSHVRTADIFPLAIDLHLNEGLYIWEANMDGKIISNTFYRK